MELCVPTQNFCIGLGVPEEQAIQDRVTLSAEEQAVLKTLMYFDVFKYPLKPSEVHQFAPIPMSPINVVPCLNFLVNNGLVFQFDNYFSLRKDESLVSRRLEGNTQATQMLKMARRFSSFISRFLFVRGVYISGSLSKGFIDEEGDVDYFIITKPGRLWITRTLLIAFKKIFLLNSKKYFCVNYFIDTDHLEIPDRNIFTATEVQTLLPMYNAELYVGFMQANSWVKDLLPNYKARTTDDVKVKGAYPIKSMVEFLLSGMLGSWIDGLMMRATMRRWQRKFSHFTPEYFEHALRSRSYVSKHHPQNFQVRVLTAMKDRISSFEDQNGIKIS